MSSGSATATLAGIPLKWLSLVVLTVQNSMLTILLVYSRTRAPPYSAAAAVFTNEMIKGAISLSVAYRNTAASRKPRELDKNSTGRTAQRWAALQTEVFSADCWKLAIPAALYVLQNNLQYIAGSNLDVASFQVSYQLKILTTAVCSVVMLRKRLNGQKWLALLALTIGVAIVQLSKIDQSSGRASNGAGMNPRTGFLAVLLACTTSGIAGVYFELVLKGSTTDLWVRNVQLSIWSLPPALVPAYWPTWSLAAPFSLPARDPRLPYMLDNFGGWVWSVIACQVVGGLVTALVIKYSDNLMKGFASSLAIVFSSIAGVFLFDTPISALFMLGCSTVLGATWLYNKPSIATAAAMNGPSLADVVDKPRYTPMSTPRQSSGWPAPIVTTANASPSSVVDVDSPIVLGASTSRQRRSPRASSISLFPDEDAFGPVHAPPGDHHDTSLLSDRVV